MSEFQTARAFSVFEREVARRRRYVRTEKAEQFLRSVRSSCKSRLMNLSSGHKFWRAQVGHDMRPDEESGAELPTPFNRDRMTPLTDRAMEGRANPKGIPVLYLCTSKEAAMSEVRPWLGSLISLGLFETKRPLRLVDCSRGKKPDDLLFLREPPEEKRDAVVWSEIDKAFSKPVARSDDQGEYVATQILSELFLDEGYDGIAYRSAFGESSLNIALFRLEDAEMTYCELHEVTSARFNFQPRANPYWVRAARKAKN